MASKPLTKNQIVTALADSTKFAKKDVATVLTSLETLIQKQVKSAGSFRLLDLGKFKTRYRKARTGRNPATGKTIKIPAKTVIKFSASKAFKSLVK
ncbi:MAG: HU family DNA-binding protein [Mycoplasmataceae bacterium]|jgi:DNA-binding protein HU-beta|nr:HU family DNA-binding protein [Mycoplasmataceae bacterium]